MYFKPGEIFRMFFKLYNEEKFKIKKKGRDRAKTMAQIWSRRVSIIYGQANKRTDIFVSKRKY